MRIKLRTKIVGGLLCIFLLAAVLGGYGIVAITQLDNMNEELALITELNDTVNRFVEAHHVWGSGLSLAIVHDDRSMFTGGFNPYACGYGQWKQGDGPTLIDDAQIRQLIAAVYRPHYDLHVQGGIAVGLWEEGRMDEAMALFTTVVFPAVRESTNRMSELSNRYEELRDLLLYDIYDHVSTARTVIVVLFVLAFLIFLLLSYVIIKSILTPVKRLVTVVSDVTRGEMAFNRVAADKMADDEIGTLTRDVYSLVDTIKGMVDDIAKFAYENKVNGDIEYRIDTSKYQGAYREMLVSLSEFTDDFVDNMLMLLGAIGNVNNGNFNAELRTLPGKKIILNQTADALMANLNSVKSELNTVIDAIANKGDLSVKIDAGKYEGGWGEIMEGLNNIAKAVDTPLKVIQMSMREMEAGNFDIQAMNKIILSAGYDPEPSNHAGAFREIISGVDSVIEITATYIGIISQALKAVAEGDLTATITQDFLGSYSEIKDSLNNISASLNKTMSEINSASEQVLSGAKQISSSSMDLANGASTQASSIQELNASVDLINQQTKQNADNAAEANTLSQTSTDNAREGNSAMQQTLGAMNQIKDSSNNISKIIKTIQDIAFQTNLLALNAAVEAARAGEHGKGFAVVAEEVRSLAARSQEAASETTELIGTSISTVESGSEIAQSTAETLNTIVDNANKVLDIVSNISTSSQEQAEAISQVVMGLQQISQVVQSNSAVSEEAAAASEELNSQAEVLQQLVSFFKL